MKKKIIDFLISYEHKGRDQDLIVLLKQELEKRGYTVLFHCSYENNVYNFPCLQNIKPKCVIVPAAYNYEVVEYFSFALVGLVKKIINLQWEQILCIHEEEDKKCYHNPKGFARNVIHLCWGNSTKQRLINSGVPESKCIVTGPGHMDILREPYNKNILDKKGLSKIFNIDLHKKWILFISSFAINDLSEQIKEFNKNAIGTEYFNDLYDYSLKSRKEILYWFDKYLSNTKDSIIIYRPHPDEINKYNELKKLEDKYDNFKIISDLVITNWINSADVILNWYSTSKAYVVFQNKFEYLLRPFPIEKRYEMKIFEGDSFITTYEEFNEVLTKDNIKKYPMSDISSYYDFDKSIPTYKRIADVCENVLSSKKYNLKFSFKYFLIFYLKCLKRFVIKVISFILPNISYVKKWKKQMLDADLFLKEGYKRNVITEEDIKNIISN